MGHAMRKPVLLTSSDDVGKPDKSYR